MFVSWPHLLRLCHSIPHRDMLRLWSLLQVCVCMCVSLTWPPWQTPVLLSLIIGSAERQPRSLPLNSEVWIMWAHQCGAVIAGAQVRLKIYLFLTLCETIKLQRTLGKSCWQTDSDSSRTGASECANVVYTESPWPLQHWEIPTTVILKTSEGYMMCWLTTSFLKSELTVNNNGRRSCWGAAHISSEWHIPCT